MPDRRRPLPVLTMGRARRTAEAFSPAALRPGFHLEPGMRVGLFGGTFDPAHVGHAHVAETARTRLRLDRVIWLVTPQNPLKPRTADASTDRLASARRYACGPSMIVSDWETRLGSAYTIDTIRVLKARFPAVRFVWLMGGDSLAGFQRWRGWADILRTVPVAVVARPDVTLRALHAPMAQRFGFARIPSRRARSLPDLVPPAWAYLEAPLHAASSTALRGISAGANADADPAALQRPSRLGRRRRADTRPTSCSADYAV